ncbi:MAG: YicC family protein [Methylobacteriaceae bacterium]|nr:YicC family protein [Methylobacteriaceae bacterium]MBV9634794.1 YicC family protein [Methylobacteriaceae bacterium]
MSSQETHAYSMTGFARVAGFAPPYHWTWEIKSVNAKGLDVRLRLPSGFDAIESAARSMLTQRLARGACYATLTADREASARSVRLNVEALAALVAALREAPIGPDVGRVSVDGLLAAPGVVETIDADVDEAALAAAGTEALAGLGCAIDALLAMRRIEGASLACLVEARLEAIDRLTHAADIAPARRPEAIRARLAQTVAALLETPSSLDANRLHQEAVLLAAKADVREELDRLKTHVAAARQLLVAGGPIGRRLDFLAQELAREANTLCAKAIDISLTTIGLDLKTEIEQFREQIQNLE